MSNRFNRFNRFELVRRPDPSDRNRYCCDGDLSRAGSELDRVEPLDGEPVQTKLNPVPSRL